MTAKHGSWVRITLGVIPFALAGASCGPQASHRESVLAQQDADSQAKLQELAPAEGCFVGSIRLTRSGERFDASLTLLRVLENARTTQSTDPSVTTALAKLSGNLRFPALDAVVAADDAGREDFAELLNPLGWQGTALIDFGDFDPRSGRLTLPYQVTTYSQGAFGEVSGTLSGDRFTGTWFCKSFGIVAQLDLRRDAGGCR